jgi:HAD superfamily hydrolase (TIGR01484 family)
MKQKLIALDLDGTTLNDQSLLSVRTKNVLARLQKDNHLVMIATGRPYRNSKEFYETLKMTTPLVNFNGALCHNPTDSNWRNYYHKTLNKDFAMDLINEKDDAAVAFLHFLQYRFKAFLEFPTVLSSRNQ